MGRRSKADLYGVIDRILKLYSQDKLTINEIAERLQTEGIDMSREAVRRSLKSTKELALELKQATEEARVMMEAVRTDPNTNIMEAVTSRMGGLILTEMKAMQEIEFESIDEATLAISRIANAQTKLSSLRMKYQSGFEAAKREVLEALQRELKTNHPDILERLSMLIGALEAEKT